MIDKHRISATFGRAAATYEEHAAIQKQMAHALLAQAQASGQSFFRILEIGCGTGYLTRLFSQAYPDAVIIASDISPAMVAHASALQPAGANVRFICQDGENLTVEGSFDLIISNAAIQWFSDYARAFDGFAARLRDDGLLLYATFGPETFCELHDAFRAARHSLALPADVRHGPAFICAAKLAEQAAISGLSCRHHEEKVQLSFSTVRDFLLSIKKVGANQSSQPTAEPFQRRLLPEMMRCYEQYFRSADGLIPATYHLLFGSAKKQGSSPLSTAACG